MALISEQRLRKIWHGVFRGAGQKVVVINIDYMGLGNRIKFLANFHANYGLDHTTLFWNRRGWVSSPMHELLHIEGVNGLREFPMPKTPLLPPIICHPSKPQFRERGYWRLDVFDELPETFFIERHGLRFPSIDFQFSNTPQRYIDKYSPFFSMLRPAATVAERMAQIPVTEDFVCVQVRNTTDAGDHANVPKLTSVINRMRAFPDSTKFFVSCLDLSFANVLRQAFGERLFELPAKNYRSMCDATADMFLLSRGGTLLMSQGSTFGEVPWWLGGCRQRVIQMPPDGQREVESTASLP